MADHTRIEWTDATWNPITGCTLVSDGCRHCYAATLAATRLKNHPSRAGLARLNAAGEAKFTGEVRLNNDWIDQPLRWRKSRRIFVCAHGDLFHEAVPDEWIDRVFAVMALAPRHVIQVLTKRPERMREYFSALAASPSRRFDVLLAARRVGATLMELQTIEQLLATLPLPNVWLGTSVEDQATADARIPHLLATPATVRFVSAEPLLGPVDITQPQFGEMHCAARCNGNCLARGDEECPDQYDMPKLDWLIVGGESGRKARPMHPDWARSLRDQCQDAGIPFFFKQWGEWAPDYPWPGSATETTQRAFWHDSCGLIFDTPAQEDGLSFFSDGHVLRVGKRAAGRLLDGREWNEVPG